MHRNIIGEIGFNFNNNNFYYYYYQYVENIYIAYNYLIIYLSLINKTFSLFD